MRDFMISEAQSRQTYGRLTWVVRVISNWRARKTLKQLQGFSDYQLRDIGVTRHDLNRLMCLPFDVDIAWHIERRELHDAKSRPTEYTSLALPALGRATSPWLQIPPSFAAKSLSVQKIQRGTFSA
jgi:uncharacterized protein YjiS (DUF1127 family)